MIFDSENTENQEYQENKKLTVQKGWTINQMNLEDHQQNCCERDLCMHKQDGRIHETNENLYVRSHLIVIGIDSSITKNE